MTGGGWFCSTTPSPRRISRLTGYFAGWFPTIPVPLPTFPHTGPFSRIVFYCPTHHLHPTTPTTMHLPYLLTFLCGTVLCRARKATCVLIIPPRCATLTSPATGGSIKSLLSCFSAFLCLLVVWFVAYTRFHYALYAILLVLTCPPTVPGSVGFYTYSLCLVFSGMIDVVLVYLCALHFAFWFHFCTRCGSYTLARPTTTCVPSHLCILPRFLLPQRSFYLLPPLMVLGSVLRYLLLALALRFFLFYHAHCVYSSSTIVFTPSLVRFIFAYIYL